MQSKINPAQSLGFPPIISVSSLNSIAHFFGTSKNRCGIYLLEFPDSVFYIGQAIDVVRRFNQHRKSHNDITGFSFTQIPKKELDAKEKYMIFKAENLGFRLSNSVHATNITGETDFDFVVNKEEQERWSENPKSVNQSDKPSIIELPDSQIIRYRKNYKKFSDHPKSNEVITILKKFVTSCIPFPRRTEYSFWAISCMPGTNFSTWPRLVAVNMSVMEIFVIGFLKESIDELWGFVNIASDELLNHWGSINKFKKEFPFTDIFETDYRDAGQHQISLETRGLKNLQKLLDEKSIQMASACLNLRLMRKRATIYSKYHCKDLSDKCVV